MLSTPFSSLQAVSIPESLSLLLICVCGGSLSIIVHLLKKHLLSSEPCCGCWDSAEGTLLPKSHIPLTLLFLSQHAFVCSHSKYGRTHLFHSLIFLLPLGLRRPKCLSCSSCRVSFPGLLHTPRWVCSNQASGQSLTDSLSKGGDTSCVKIGPLLRATERE